MDYETKLLEREQHKAITMTQKTIEQLKIAGYDDQAVYSFIKKLDTGLSDDTLHNMINQHY